VARRIRNARRDAGQEPRHLSQSGYKAMWLFAMFDLPVLSKEQRKRATRFRKHLLTHGFCMLQFSVYARHCPTEDSAVHYRDRVASDLPPEGQVRLLSVTDRQFGKMKVFIGNSSAPPEPTPVQLMLF
jgi:CRISPR-associated protein Cas2